MMIKHQICGICGMEMDEHQVRTYYRFGMLTCKVCGMRVNLKSTPPRLVYQGKVYYFCSTTCKKIFDVNPAKYAGSGGREMAGHGGHMM